MMKTIQGLPDGVVGIEASGEVTSGDYETVREPAIQRALKGHAKIRLLYQIDREFSGFTAVTPPPAVFDAAARQLSECVARLQVDATCKVLDRPAAAAIVSEAESIGAELVVASARGKTGLSLLPLGSIAEKVARTAPCSVLVVRPSPGA